MQFKWEKIGIKTRVDKNQLSIFDPYRKKYILATPEEEVRQFVLYQLRVELGYPINTISVERQVKYLNMRKRFDALVYVGGKPKILIECKASHISLTQRVFDQVCEYNFVLKVPFLMITNGPTSLFAQIDFENKTHKLIDNLPDYYSLSN